MSVMIVLFVESILVLTTPKGPAVKTLQGKYYKTEDQFGIVWALQGQHKIVLFNNKNQSAIYDVVYTIDPYGKRYTPVENSEQRNQFLMFFGCSFTFGEGLEDNETVPYEVAALTKDFMPYNFGFHGDGPFDMLAKVENYPLNKWVKEGSGKMVYMFLDGHVQRVLGSMRVMSWNEDRPYYKLSKDGKLVRTGTFYNNRVFLTNFYRFLLKSRILQKFGVEHIFPVTESDLKLTALAINSFYSKFKEQYPGAEMHIIFYPGSKYQNRILKYLDTNHVKVLDYSALFDRNDSRFVIGGDGHPSHYANQVVAQQIVTDLNLN